MKLDQFRFVYNSKEKNPLSSLTYEIIPKENINDEEDFKSLNVKFFPKIEKLENKILSNFNVKQSSSEKERITTSSISQSKEYLLIDIKNDSIKEDEDQIKFKFLKFFQKKEIQKISKADYYNSPSLTISKDSTKYTPASFYLGFSNLEHNPNLREVIFQIHEYLTNNLEVDENVQKDINFFNEITKNQSLNRVQLEKLLY